MAATYPAGTKAFTTKVDGAPNIIYAAHMNDVQDEIVALENDLRGVLPISRGGIGPVGAAGTILSGGSPATWSASLTLGTNPASAGIIRIPNGQYIRTRNNANTADLDIAVTTATDNLRIGTLSLGQLELSSSAAIFNFGSVSYYNLGLNSFAAYADNGKDLGNAANRWKIGYFGTAISVGTNPAASGAVRLANNVGVVARNAANSGDFSLVRTDTSDNVVVSTLGTAATYLDSGGVIYLRPNAGATVYAFDSPTGFFATIDNARDLGASNVRWHSGYFGTSVSIGTNPAATGALRLANNQSIVSRNAANDADIPLIYLNANNAMVVGYGAAYTTYGAAILPNPSGTVQFGSPSAIWSDGHFNWLYAYGSLIVGTTTAQQGAIRLPNNTVIYARNAANTADLAMLQTGTDNSLVLGSAVSPLYMYSSVQISFLPGAGAISYTMDGLGFYPGSDNNRNLGWSTLRWLAGYFSTSISIGTNPAQSGAIRLANNAGIYNRNAANTADLNLIRIDSSNAVNVGDTTNAGIYIFSGALIAFQSASYMRMYVNGGSENIYFDSVTFRPNSNGIVDLGLSSYRWKSVSAIDFIGSGAQLTGLNATQLTSGTVPDARLSANVPRLDAIQTFTQQFTISATTPGFNFIETDQVANQKNWQMLGLSGNLVISASNDAWTAQQSFTFSRSGNLTVPGNILATKTRPEMQLLDPSGSGKARFQQVAADTFNIAQNLSFDGVGNWNLDDVAKPGLMLAFNPGAGVAVFLAASAGANPRTLVNMLTINNAGTISTAGLIIERNRSIPLGQRNLWTPAFTTAEGGTVGASSVDARFSVVGNMVFWNLYTPAGLVVPSPTAYIQFTMPPGFLATANGSAQDQNMIRCYVTANEAGYTEAANGVIRIYRLNLTNWPTATIFAIGQGYYYID